MRIRSVETVLSTGRSPDSASDWGRFPHSFHATYVRCYIAVEKLLNELTPDQLRGA